jgi:hypothetical protein
MDAPSMLPARHGCSIDAVPRRSRAPARADGRGLPGRVVRAGCLGARRGPRAAGPQAPHRTSRAAAAIAAGRWCRGPAVVNSSEGNHPDRAAAPAVQYRMSRSGASRRLRARRDNRYCSTAPSRSRTTLAALAGMPRIPVARPGPGTGTDALLRSRAARLRRRATRSRRCSDPVRSRRSCRSQPGPGT